MPGTEDTNQPITVDLNGKVAIRAQANSDAQPTEIVLQNSRRDGAEIRLATDRRYLVRAAQLGFDRIYFPSDTVPAVCDDGHRTYVWALLSKEGIIAPTADATVIESPMTPGTAVANPRPVVPITNHIPIQEPVNAMKTNASPAVARKTTQSQSTAPAPSGSSIEQAIAFHTGGEIHNRREACLHSKERNILAKWRFMFWAARYWLFLISAVGPSLAQSRDCTGC